MCRYKGLKVGENGIHSEFWLRRVDVSIGTIQLWTVPHSRKEKFTYLKILWHYSDNFLRLIYRIFVSYVCGDSLLV